MSIIRKVCCVCGTQYGILTDKDGLNTIRISHGFCSEACTEYDRIQFMTKKEGTPTLVDLVYSQNRFYDEGKLLKVYYKASERPDSSWALTRYEWSNELGCYRSNLVCEADTRSACIKHYSNKEDGPFMIAR